MAYNNGYDTYLKGVHHITKVNPLVLLFSLLGLRLVSSDDVEVRQHLLEDCVLGEVTPVLLLGHGIGDGEEVLKMFLHLLHGLPDLASWWHPHARDLLASHLGGESQEPGHQSWDNGVSEASWRILTIKGNKDAREQVLFSPSWVA